MHTIFVGDPGVGKSTLLNGLVNQTIFSSGPSSGSGLTQVWQTCHDRRNGDYWSDTPGRADCLIANEAAAEIVKALKFRANFKLVFVITDISGRIQDNRTIQYVLNALPPRGTIDFGVIVNKVTAAKIKHLQSNKSDYQQFVASINKNLPHTTDRIHLYKRLEQLEDEANVLHTPTEELKAFIESIPGNQVDPVEIGEVGDNEMKQLEEERQRQQEEH